MEQIFAHIKSIGIFTIILSIMIIVHEWGHFITAKKLGVRVEKFSIGFGKKLYSRVIDGTEFIISAIPLGGYVKPAGEDRSTCKGTPDEFYSQSPGRRSLIVLNGPMVNIIFAYVVFIFVFMLGYPDLSTSISNVIDDYPAKTAGIQVDDKVLAVNGVAVENWTELQTAIAKSTTPELLFKIQRGEDMVDIRLQPKIDSGKDIFGVVREKRMVGIQPKPDIISLRYDFLTSTRKALDKMVEIVTMTYQALYHMIFGSMSPKDAVAGPIGIYSVVKLAAEAGFSHVLYVMGVISASLGIFNLLPIYPLDGAHICLFGLEKIRGRALPRKVDEIIARLGLTFIILLALFVFYLDITRLEWVQSLLNK
ncbi:MAG: M50 family metallopeptidase [Candidatus Omnitrophica bacterium]|nr:M50 family metallopeptidase [Candidatus Omnitrophota bacterium]